MTLTFLEISACNTINTKMNILQKSLPCHFNYNVFDREKKENQQQSDTMTILHSQPYAQLMNFQTQSSRERKKFHTLSNFFIYFFTQNRLLCCVFVQIHTATKNIHFHVSLFLYKAIFVFYRALHISRLQNSLSHIKCCCMLRIIMVR